MSYDLEHCGSCGFIHTGPCALPIPVLCPKEKNRVMGGLHPESTEAAAFACCHVKYWARLVDGKVRITYRGNARVREEVGL